jgi:hypothetical protein
MQIAMAANLVSPSPSIHSSIRESHILRLQRGNAQLELSFTTPALPEDQMKELWRALQRTTASTEAVVEST